MPAHNERFGATAAGGGDLKGSGGMLPPSRHPVVCHARRRCRRSNRTENGVQPDNDVKTETDTNREYSPTMWRKNRK